jgi:hypothetical protein
MKVSIDSFSVLLIATQTLAYTAWPSQYAEGRNGLAEEREGVVRRFFRWLGFVRPPIFGFSTYNHVDLGEPGEVRNNVDLRLGPKPNIFFENSAAEQYANQPLKPPVWGNHLSQGPRLRRSTRVLRR